MWQPVGEVTTHTQTDSMGWGGKTRWAKEYFVPVPSPLLLGNAATSSAASLPNTAPPECSIKLIVSDSRHPEYAYRCLRCGAEVGVQHNKNFERCMKHLEGGDCKNPPPPFEPGSRRKRDEGPSPTSTGMVLDRAEGDDAALSFRPLLAQVAPGVDSMITVASLRAAAGPSPFQQALHSYRTIQRRRQDRPSSVTPHGDVNTMSPMEGSGEGGGNQVEEGGGGLSQSGLGDFGHAIVLLNPKTPANVGSALRAAACFSGCAAVLYTGTRFETARRFQVNPLGDTGSVPLLNVCADVTPPSGMLSAFFKPSSRPPPPTQHHDHIVDVSSPSHSSSPTAAIPTITATAVDDDNAIATFTTTTSTAVVMPGGRSNSRPTSAREVHATDCRQPVVRLIAVDLIDGAVPLHEFSHPVSHAVYIFGPEDGTIPQSVVDACDEAVFIPTRGCLNLAASVNVVMYDRWVALRSALQRRKHQQQEEEVEVEATTMDPGRPLAVPWTMDPGRPLAADGAAYGADGGDSRSVTASSAISSSDLRAATLQGGPRDRKEERRPTRTGGDPSDADDDCGAVGSRELRGRRPNGEYCEGGHEVGSRQEESVATNRNANNRVFFRRR